MGDRDDGLGFSAQPRAGRLNLPALARLTAVLTSPADTFGLDQRVQFAIDGSLPDRAAIAKCYYRPVQEPVLVSFWDHLTRGSFDEKTALDIVGLMTGSRTALRAGTKAGRDAGSGETFVFDRSDPRRWFEFAGRTTPDGDPADRLTDVYFQLTWIHPFDDGNGRFARGLIYGILAEAGVISSPCLGLNAVFDLRRDRIGAAFRQAATTGDKNALRVELCSAINLAAHLANGVLRGNYQAELDI